MTRLRALVALVAVVVALVLQVSLFPHLAWQGIVPNLCLLVVVASALTINAPSALLLGFAAGELLTIKEVGLGMAIAVVLDATVVRMLLVPATMKLMGRWNWWAPGPLRRLHRRVGLAERPSPALSLPGGRRAGAGR